MGMADLLVLGATGVVGGAAVRLALDEPRILRPVLPRRWRAVTGPQVAKSLLRAVLEAEEGIHIIESEALQE